MTKKERHLFLAEDSLVEKGHTSIWPILVVISLTYVVMHSPLKPPPQLPQQLNGH